MFGLIYSLFVTIGLAGHNIKNKIENEENKTKYRHKNGLTYVDTKGRNRLILNNELVYYTHDINGDYILKDAKGCIYRNFSKEEREQKIEANRQKALKNGETTYCIDEDSHRKSWVKKGKRFKDIETGDIYIIRYINYRYYYMRLSDAMLIRKTDWEIKTEERGGDTYVYFKDVDIEEFNKKQKTITDDDYKLYREWEYNYGCNEYK